MISKAIIFAAGLGTRLKPWTDKHPKALVPVNGKTLLERNIRYLQEYRIYDVVVNVHHFPEQIIDLLEQNKGWGSRVRISDESDEVLETGGGLLKASEFLINNDPFLAINSDILTDLSLKELFDFHIASNALITLAVSNRASSRQLLFNKQGRLCGWRNIDKNEEKIAVHDPGLSGKAFSGISVYQPEIFGHILLKGKFSLIDLFLSLASTHSIVGYDHSGNRFIDVGKPGSVEAAERLFE